MNYKVNQLIIWISTFFSNIKCSQPTWHMTSDAQKSTNKQFWNAYFSKKNNVVKLPPKKEHFIQYLTEWILKMGAPYKLAGLIAGQSINRQKKKKTGRLPENSRQCHAWCTSGLKQKKKTEKVNWQKFLFFFSVKKCSYSACGFGWIQWPYLIQLLNWKLTSLIPISTSKHSNELW